MPWPGVTFRNKVLWPLAQPPSWMTTPCRLSATAYSIYSQLPNLEAVSYIRDPRMRNAVVTGTHIPWAAVFTYYVIMRPFMTFSPLFLFKRKDGLWYHIHVSVSPYNI
jgi:hypothetical protein